jgi:hypothetical protein
MRAGRSGGNGDTLLWFLAGRKSATNWLNWSQVQAAEAGNARELRVLRQN